MSIEKLNKIVDRNIREREELEEVQRKIRELNERWEEVQKAPDYKRLDFWCSECKKDFQATGTKHEIETYKIGKYEARCLCGNKCRRIIGEYDWDYYQNSELIKQQRARYSKDILQPHEYGFETLYGKKYGQDKERKAWKRKLQIAL